MYLTQEWKSFARARGLKEGHTFHFKFDGAATLFLSIFGEASVLLECRVESNNSNNDHSSTSDDDDNSGNTSSGGSGSDDHSDDPPRSRIKEEEDSD